MSDDKKTLSKELLQNQIKNAESFIEQAQKQISNLQNQVQQQLGIAGLAKHLLETFTLPEKEVVEEKKELEVK
jgi:hypothetical protein